MELREKIVKILSDAYADGVVEDQPNTMRHADRIEALFSESKQWVSVEELASELDKEGQYLDNPHDHETDRAAGKAYKDCAERMRKLIPQQPKEVE